MGLFPQGVTSEGLEDMVGNVYEWCSDWYGQDYYARSQDAHNPPGPDKGDYRVLRGGSWANDGPLYCRCGYRFRGDPHNGYDNWGFRCARILSS